MLNHVSVYVGVVHDKVEVGSDVILGATHHAAERGH